MLCRSPSLSSLGGDAHLQVEGIRRLWPRKNGMDCVDRDRALSPSRCSDPTLADYPDMGIVVPLRLGNSPGGAACVYHSTYFDK